MTRLRWPDGEFVRYTGWSNRAVKDVFRNAASGDANRIGHPEYDSLNRIDRWQLGVANDLAVWNPTYDDAQRLDSLNLSASGGAGYDNLSSFTYNPASQIATRTRDNPAFTWDDQSSGTTRYTANGLNQYSNVNPPGAGSITPQYDELGALSDYDGRSFSYDAIGRLASTSMNGEQTKFEYDPLGRLYSVNAPGTANDRRFLWDRASIIAEYSGLSGTGTLIRRYVHSQPGGLGAPFAVSERASMTAASIRAAKSNI